ncbi:MAG: phenylalanine--tRNA ligase beta subunit-related protein [Rectinema sp.]
METELKFAEDERLRKVNIALVELEGIDWGRAAEVVPEALRNEVLQCARDAGAGAFGAFEAFEARIKAVRDMLRNGKYKPAGRAKPSSEYLFAAALDNSFPRVNPFVDAVNLASLKYMYPMSIFDADKAGHALLCRLGAPGEYYVFNSSGQEIDLEDLVCLCALAPAFAAESAAKECALDAAGSAGADGRPTPGPNPLVTQSFGDFAAGHPLPGSASQMAQSFGEIEAGRPTPSPNPLVTQSFGDIAAGRQPHSHTETSQPEPRPHGRPIVNPVRDSMATKLFEGARNALIVVYAPGAPYEAEGRDLEAAARDLAAWCGRACERTAIKVYSLS